MPWLLVPVTCCALRLSGPGIQVDEFIMQLIGLRYTEPDLTVSYPGFLFLMMKLETMIRKRGIDLG